MEVVMAYVDMTLPQFQKQFASEKACLEAIFDARWPRGFICPKCGHNDGVRLRSRIRVVECSACHRQTSITSGTLFHRSHLPLILWFLSIYLFAQDKGGASASRLSKQVGMSYPTAWFVLQRLRLAMQTRDENLTLAGYIELDEAFFGGRSKSRRNRKPPWTNKKTVLVLVESEGKQAGNLVMKVVDSAQYDDLKPVIEDKVESDPGGQWFRSDAWGAHHVVMQFGHRIKMEHMFAYEQDEELRCVSLAVSHAKRFFKGTYHHFCKTHIQRYLDEFCYRWNRRHLFAQLPLHLLTASVLHECVSYSKIKAVRKPA
jgi:ISXO2-like transposase domain/Transposase zinc-ribbon domain